LRDAEQVSATHVAPHLVFVLSDNAGAGWSHARPDGTNDGSDGILPCMMSEESTTPDLVERTRRKLDFFGDGGIDAVMPFFAPDAVWDLSDAVIGVYQGANAIRRFFDDWTRSFDKHVFEVQEVLDLDYGVVLLRYRDSGRPTGGEGRVANAAHA
jgi:ketosteroid isomerase-like protein